MFIMTEGSPQIVEYYYDTLHEIVIIGAVALDNHIESGGNPADIRDLSDYLRDDDSIETPHPALDTQGWSREDSLRYGRWLLGVLESDSLPTQKHRLVNRQILERAYKIGVGPSLHRFVGKTYFGSLREFYANLSAENTHRVSNYRKKFPDWEIDDFVSYIKNTAAKLGRKPTLRDLEDLSNKNRRCPSPSLIKHRYGSLSHVYDLAGFPYINSWEHDDYINWGVKVALENNGREPNTSALIYLSVRGRGPSDKIVNKKFGSVKKYRQLVRQAYEAERLSREAKCSQKLSDIEELLLVGKIPEELFEDLDESDKKERLKRYAKYIVLEELNLPETSARSTPSTINICKSIADGNSFISAIRKKNPAIHAGHIEAIANYLGVFDDIWPPAAYAQELRLPENINSMKYGKRNK